MHELIPTEASHPDGLLFVASAGTQRTHKALRWGDEEAEELSAGIQDRIGRIVV